MDLKKVFAYFLICVLLSGCASVRELKEADVIVPEKPLAGAEAAVPAVEPPDIKEEPEPESEEAIPTKGIIFAKTDFQGLLEARYVKFLFEDLENQGHTFILHIGEDSGQQIFPWEMKSVKPGYFFVELPAGRYRIASVTIPVGTSTATEAMNVTLQVVPNTVTYVGTLKMVGTKEKIKLGGVPVIKPGFEYTIEVVDNREEGAEAFTQNYPDYPFGVSVKLMQIHPKPKTEKNE